MNIALGIMIACLAGIMNGLFPTPMAANRSWAWENNWFFFSILSLLVFPQMITWISVPHLSAVLPQLHPSEILTIVLCGILTYLGSLLFGISIVYAGVALSFALLVGSMDAVGILVPRILLTHSLFQSTADGIVAIGVLLSIVSVFLGFFAGKWKNSVQSNGATDLPKRLLGTVLAILGGLLSGFLPVAMTLPPAKHLLHTAIAYGGASQFGASNAVLCLLLLGGAVPNCGYSAYLLFTRKTYHLYRESSHGLYWILVLAMSLLYSASVALWGAAISPSLLGTLGPSVGWALFVGMIVVSSTTAGVIRGEWSGAGRKARGALLASALCLLSSMILICIGNFLSLT